MSDDPTRFIAALFPDATHTEFMHSVGAGQYTNYRFLLWAMAERPHDFISTLKDFFNIPMHGVLEELSNLYNDDVKPESPNEVYFALSKALIEVFDQALLRGPHAFTPPRRYANYRAALIDIAALALYGLAMSIPNEDFP